MICLLVYDLSGLSNQCVCVLVELPLKNKVSASSDTTMYSQFLGNFTAGLSLPLDRHYAHSRPNSLNARFEMI